MDGSIGRPDDSVPLMHVCDTYIPYRIMELVGSASAPANGHLSLLRSH